MPDAIPTDAPAANAAPAIPDLNDPAAHFSRAEAMKAMAMRRRETVQADMAPEDRAAFAASAPAATASTATADEDTDPADRIAEETRRQLEQSGGNVDPATARSAETIDAGEQLARQRDEPVILNEEDLSRYRMRTKVNGVEEVLPLDQVRTGYQKTEAADRYLAEAKGVLSDVKQTVAQLVAARTPATPASTDEPNGNTSQDGDDPIEAAFDSLFHNDAASAAKHLRTALKTNSPDPDAIAREAEQRMVLRSAMRQFAKDHKEIMSDPTLQRVADTFLLEETGGVELKKLDADRIPEALEAAGRRTKEWMKTLPGQSPAPTPRTDTRADTRARKAEIDELPSAATRAASTVPSPPTRSDVIANMKAARGQRVGSA